MFSRRGLCDGPLLVQRSPNYVVCELEISMLRRPTRALETRKKLKLQINN